MSRPRFRLWHSLAFRVALAAAVLVVGSMAVAAAFFYRGTVVVLAEGADAKTLNLAHRLAGQFAARGVGAVADEIDRTLTDGIDSDTEELLLLGPDGRKVAGNLDAWNPDGIPPDRIVDRKVLRDGRTAGSRLLVRRMADGSTLVVGRDMKDLRDIEQLVGHAIYAGGAAALLLAIATALLIRRQLERRIGAIRRTAREIEAGDLSRRIPPLGGEDELSRLALDINRMLDRIEHLMDGVRHVSNMIAHHLRTPLGRIRGHLEEPLRRRAGVETFVAAARFATEEIDELIVVLDKLMQIAEAESGTRRQPFEPVALRTLVEDLADLYDAAAEARGARIAAEVRGEPVAQGDRDLLATALASLLDNALKYAGPTPHVTLRARGERGTAILEIEDDGPGIPAEERTRVLERFYRLDRTQPGSGLGLSIVTAIASLHGARLELDDARPGLRVRMVLPTPEGKTFPDGNATERFPTETSP